MLAAMERGSAKHQNLFVYLWGDFMEYISIAQAAEKWGLSRRRVLTLCSQGRIPGVTRLGTIWMIPNDAEKPADARIKSGKYIGYSAKYRNHDDSEQSQNLEEAWAT